MINGGQVVALTLSGKHTQKEKKGERKIQNQITLYIHNKINVSLDVTKCIVDDNPFITKTCNSFDIILPNCF